MPYISQDSVAKVKQLHDMH